MNESLAVTTPVILNFSRESKENFEKEHQIEILENGSVYDRVSSRLYPSLRLWMELHQHQR